MTSARHLVKTTTLSAVTLAIGMSAIATAATTTSVHRTFGNQSARPFATRTISVLHAFAGTDGSAPQGNLDLAIQYNHNGTFTRTLYGETEGGGAAFSGTIYGYTLGSNAFSSLYQFSGANDGGIPEGGLANNETNYFAAGQVQLGVTTVGGSFGQGTVFAAGANGKPTTVHAFSGGADGGNPAGRLTQFTDGNYYGTTTTGGRGFGTVYRITPSGQFSTIYAFTGGTDGGAPQAGLALRVNLNGNANVAKRGTIADGVERARVTRSAQYVSPYLYGTTSTAGGPGGVGTIFRITPAGQLQTLYRFTGGLDGGVPVAKLSTDLNGNLYGSTTAGGSGSNGVIFKLAQNSNTPQVIHDFGNGATGAAPVAQITLALNGNLYGTASQGGASGQFGDIFEITNGGIFADIHDFQGTDGANPQGALVDGGDGNLYGTTTDRGPNFQGVLFSIPE